HIGQVRTATRASVVAVGRIEQTSSEMNAIAGSLAAAVEEPGAATSEIARNIAETASAAAEMGQRTEEVALEASATLRHAAVVQENTKALSMAINKLRHTVIHVVRTSTQEVDRRRHQRYATDLACEVSLDNAGVSPGRVADISEEGAAVTAEVALPSGVTGILALDSEGVRLRFAVRAVEPDGRAHLVFDLDAAMRQRLSGLLGRLAQRAAA